MKPNKKALMNQREVIERRLQKWLLLRSEKVPPSGWIKAIRSSLAMSSSELARRMNLDSTGILRLEEREAKKTASLESIERAARAMNCKLVYAIVPDDSYEKLGDIIDEQAIKAARELLRSVTHSMKLEKQGVDHEITESQIRELAQDLKQKMNPLLWNPHPVQRSKK